jgi:hypothetical protein
MWIFSSSCVTASNSSVEEEAPAEREQTIELQLVCCVVFSSPGPNSQRKSRQKTGFT